MKSTREKIMRHLLAFPGATIKDLAKAVEINGISVRHHLTTMEDEELIASSEERHGVGRPRFIYHLTDKGIEKFPTSYIIITKRILESLKNRFSSEEIKNLLSEIGSGIADSYKDEFKGKTLLERITLLPTILSNEGFTVEMKEKDGNYILTSFSCPYYNVLIDHPELCMMDHQLIKQLISKPVHIESCINDGDSHCSYRFNLNKKDNANG